MYKAMNELAPSYLQHHVRPYLLSLRVPLYPPQPVVILCYHGQDDESVYGHSVSLVLLPGTVYLHILGPVLFLLYTADVPVIAQRHGFLAHSYADDTQLYFYDKVSLTAFEGVYQ